MYFCVFLCLILSFWLSLRQCILFLSASLCLSVCLSVCLSLFLYIYIYIYIYLFMTSPRRGEGVRLRWTHVDGEGVQPPCGRPHRKFKLESTDVILSYSYAKKLASFL